MATSSIRNGWGKRLPVPSDQYVDWLTRRGASAGFSLDTDTLALQPGYIAVQKPGQQPIRHHAVRFDGTLHVHDPDAFRAALASGIGPGKGFGFGLLSIARGGRDGIEQIFMLSPRTWG